MIINNKVDRAPSEQLLLPINTPGFHYLIIPAAKKGNKLESISTLTNQQTASVQPRFRLIKM